MKTLTLLITLVLSISLNAQEFHEEVTKVFNFFPHKMTSDEQKAVFPKLDKFFDLVIKNKEKYINPLRDELKRIDNNPYFYWDGGLLLMEISKEASDIQLVADALVKADLRDLPANIYLQHLMRLSLNNADVIEGALHILDDTSFNAYFAQHAMELKYGEGLKFILPRYNSDLYIDKLISKFKLINSIDNKITCLDLFIYANNCKADSFLISIRDDSNQPKQIKDKIAETLKLTEVSRDDNRKKYMKAFEERKEKLNRISDEAVYELNDLTLDMRKSFECK